MKKTEVLIGTDFSDSSQMAIESGIYLAEKMNCHPVVVHVHDMDIDYAASRVINNKLAEQFDNLSNEIQLSLYDKLSKQLRHWSLNKKEVEFDIIYGDKIKKLVEYAKNRNSKLIVVGLSQEMNNGHFFIGSMIERLVRSSSIPILIVKNNRIKNIKKIVVPYAIDDVSFSAFEWGKVFTHYFTSKIDYFHAVEPSCSNAIG